MSWFSFRLPAVVLILAASGGASAQEGPDWSNVGPLFAERCVICHSGEEAPSGLRLDSYEGAVEGSRNGPVLAPGDPAGSELVRRVRGVSQPSMPLVGQALNAEEIAMIEDWIHAGLPDGSVAHVEPPPAEETAPTMLGPDDPVTFAQVEPIFLQRCAVCHSDARPEGPPEGLRLDSYENIIRGGSRCCRGSRTRARSSGASRGRRGRACPTTGLPGSAMSRCV